MAAIAVGTVATHAYSHGSVELVVRAGGQFGKAHCLQFAADGAFIKRYPVLLENPTRRILQFQAHNAMDLIGGNDE